MSYPVIITYSNYGFVEMAENLLINIGKKAPNHRVVFYSLDEKIHIYLSEKFKNNSKYEFIPWYQDNISQDFHIVGTKSFIKLIQIKFHIIKKALQTYQKIFYIDCDVVFLKEPDPKFYDIYQDYDILFQSDKYPPESQNDITVCAGVMLIKNSVATNNFVDSIIKIQYMIPEISDQDAIYKYFEVNDVKSLDELKTLKIICAPCDIFMSGIFVRELKTMPGPATYLFHANFVKGKMNKCRLIAKVGEWYL
jgi:hypothetical protein